MNYQTVSIQELEQIYGTPSRASLVKVAKELTPNYRAWIFASKFCVLSTVGPDGTDGSPRGDEGPVVQELDASTLLMPDWRGNNRMDSLKNIIQDGRLSLLFLVPGSNSAVRVNGTGIVSTDPDLISRFSDRSKTPRSVIVIAIKEIYFQCARALMRSDLWTTDHSPANELPGAGQILEEMSAGDEGGDEYDRAWPERAKKTLW